MIELLARLFIKNRSDTSSSEVRNAYGKLCGAVGIFFNILLSALKFTAGLISGSIAVTADAFNNLSDAGSSVIMLIGFRFAGQKPDTKHPFGHGRVEYVAGLIVSIIIIVMGFELGMSSIEKIVEPTKPEFNIFVLAVLVLSVIVKLYMFLYNRHTAKRFSSAAINATASDSLSDSIATFTVLICTLLSYFYNFNIDGWCGMLVALFILFTGIKSAAETVSPLLGQPPEDSFVKKIEALVLSSEHIVGMHDLAVHDYGPGRVIISLHAEVPAKSNLEHIHDEIDNIERRLSRELDCEAIIHTDPIETDNETVIKLKAAVEELVKNIDPELTIHDFRIVSGPTHTNMIFDLVIPYNVKESDKEITDTVFSGIRTLDATYTPVINIDRSFVR